jgi:serine/threonine protein kinase
MMEYSFFDFRPFGVEKSLCTLENFVHFVDDDFDSFADLLPTCATDVVAGLKYLHNKNIAHRDLVKAAGNIWLTQFGLSRSLDLQTKSILCQ